jgi:hypothetical protein
MYGKKQSESQKQKTREKFLITQPHKNTFWWNNGIVEIRSKDNPGNDFIKGRIRKFKNKNKMKVKIVSDLHLESCENNHGVPDLGSGEILILGGDILCARHFKQMVLYIRSMMISYKSV